ncbi:MAG: flippase-like domain-containing protein, partial [Candidatus Omnitrophica bacterium]|nr:flippase-like domain-containing protein [Candidatus Omnitrophota bacterium]
MKRKIFFILRFFLSGAIIFAIFKVIPYRDVISVYQRAYKFYLFFGFLFIFLGNIIASLRWRFVINSLGASLSIREALYAFFSSTAFNLIFPSLLAGDIFRGFALSTRFKNQTRKVISSLIVDRASGMVSLALLVVFSYLIGRSLIREPEVLAGVILMVTLGVFIILAIFNSFIFSLVKKIFTGRKKAEERIYEFEKEFQFLRKRPSIFWRTAIYFSLPVQIVTVFSFFFVCKSFYIDL